MDTFYDRIDRIADHYKMKTGVFLRRCGVSYSTFRSARFRGFDPQLKTVLRILNTCPKVRMEWLITGEGEMLKPGSDEADKAKESAEIASLKKQIGQLKEMLLEKEKRIIELEIGQNEQSEQ